MINVIIVASLTCLSNNIFLPCSFVWLHVQRFLHSWCNYCMCKSDRSSTCSLLYPYAHYLKVVSWSFDIMIATMYWTLMRIIIDVLHIPHWCTTYSSLLNLARIIQSTLIHWFPLVNTRQSRIINPSESSIASYYKCQSMLREGGLQKTKQPFSAKS